MPSPLKTDLPVFDAVAHTGDATIIESTLQGQAVLNQLAAMQRDCTSDGMARVLDGHRLPGAAPISFPTFERSARTAGDTPGIDTPGDDTHTDRDPPASVGSDAIETVAAIAADADIDADRDRAAAVAGIDAVLEQRIDALIAHHVCALRRDLMALLSRERA